MLSLVQMLVGSSMMHAQVLSRVYSDSESPAQVGSGSGLGDGC